MGLSADFDTYEKSSEVSIIMLMFLTKVFDHLPLSIDSTYNSVILQGRKISVLPDYGCHLTFGGDSQGISSWLMPGTPLPLLISFLRLSCEVSSIHKGIISKVNTFNELFFKLIEVNPFPSQATGSLLVRDLYPTSVGYLRA